MFLFSPLIGIYENEHGYETPEKAKLEFFKEKQFLIKDRIRKSKESIKKNEKELKKLEDSFSELYDMFPEELI